MNEILKRLQQIGIVPVVKLDRVEDALPLAKALMEGGLPCAEVTFRTDAAKDAIKAMSDAYPEMLIGAGTVLTKQQVDDAVEAGATFIVSPGLNPEIVKYCVNKDILIVPGCSNPSDVEQAISFGLDVVKFFPAEAFGGLATIKAMASAYVNMKFMPTGGINEKNLKSYLDFPKIVACGGSWMVNADLINDGKFDDIRKIAQKAVNEMLGFELGHIGINGNDEAEAEKIASQFELLFGFEKKVGNTSVFAGDAVEVTKKPYLGEKGHIAIKTNYIDRAVAYLEYNKFGFNMDTAKYDVKGNLIAVYLKETFGGFALHLVQKK
jgi:2-dehydro-3-deoxyphosphogluconate aldolase/(4S)-4-hydroxy-2-oxoglutarate aldolase